MPFILFHLVMSFNFLATRQSEARNQKELEDKNDRKRDGLISYTFTTRPNQKKKNIYIYIHVYIYIYRCIHRPQGPDPQPGQGFCGNPGFRPAAESCGIQILEVSGPEEDKVEGWRSGRPKTEGFAAWPEFCWVKGVVKEGSGSAGGGGGIQGLRVLWLLSFKYLGLRPCQGKVEAWGERLGRKFLWCLEMGRRDLQGLF